jgi:hypothetical protein
LAIRTRRFILGIAAVLAAVAVILAVSGGFRITVGGLRLSARSPLLVVVLAFVNFTIWLRQARRANAVETDLDAIWKALHRPSTFIVATALIGGIVSFTYATRSASGADASGYVSEAALLMSGELFHDDQLKDVARGQDPYLTTPLGWRPAPVEGRQSPTYAPGLPMLMAIPHAVAGINGASFTVIASAVVAIIATGSIATHLGGAIAGILAAVLIAFTPVFMYQSIQPMSDVPVTAAWMVCFALLCGRASRSSSLLAGIACAIAVLIRPNLAPLAIIPLLIARRRVAFAIPVACAGIVLAMLQSLWYGSPLQSGYGTAGELFSVTSILPNIGRYSRWWLTTAPALLIGVAGAIRLRSNAIARTMTAFAVLVVGAYLIYAVFDEWSYLRFLLPALAVAAVFTGVEVAHWIERRSIGVRVPLLFAVVLGVTAYSISIARSVNTFQLADQLARVATVAQYLNAHVPPSAVLLTGEQSGSMRYYTGRPILRWEAASPDALHTVIPVLEQSNRPVFIVLDAWEEGSFRSKLGAAVPLDWPPMLEAGATHRTRVWRFDDRARYLRGDAVDTARRR